MATEQALVGVRYLIVPPDHRFLSSPSKMVKLWIPKRGQYRFVH
jgi:hypothetical protein